MKHRAGPETTETQMRGAVEREGIEGTATHQKKVDEGAADGTVRPVVRGSRRKNVVNAEQDTRNHTRSRGRTTQKAGGGTNKDTQPDGKDEPGDTDRGGSATKFRSKPMRTTQRWSREEPETQEILSS